jgi:AAA+ ATPase superfamily predicted ATPase
MTKDKKNQLEYRKEVAFINRERELSYLAEYMNTRPESILFIHGPKSSGKTTLLYKFFEQVEKRQDLDVKFLNLRKTYKDKSNYKDFLKVLFEVADDKDEKKEKLSAGINVGFFKISSGIEKKMQQGKVDPFKVMEKEFIRANEKQMKPVVIIDELQALDNIYLNNGRDRQLIIELFNFFVAMTKESHLAHIMIASSDGYFIDRVFIDSRLKKCSKFFKVDYLPKEDVMEWLLNLEKYSKIKDYTLTREEAEKIWEMVAGSMWEIQDILFELFQRPLADVLEDYKRSMRGLITDYIVTKGRKKREKVLGHFIDSDRLLKKDVDEEDEDILRDMVRNNILYFDPTEATYYPQGKSYHWGIRLYFESLTQP